MCDQTGQESGSCKIICILKVIIDMKMIGTPRPLMPDIIRTERSYQGRPWCGKCWKRCSPCLVSPSSASHRKPDRAQRKAHPCAKDMVLLQLWIIKACCITWQELVPGLCRDLSAPQSWWYDQDRSRDQDRWTSQIRTWGAGVKLSIIHCIQLDIWPGVINKGIIYITILPSHIG